MYVAYTAWEQVLTDQIQFLLFHRTQLLIESPNHLNIKSDVRRAIILKLFLAIYLRKPFQTY